MSPDGRVLLKLSAPAATVWLEQLTMEADVTTF
jgi:hypothetical protein